MVSPRLSPPALVSGEALVSSSALVTTLLSLPALLNPLVSHLAMLKPSDEYSTPVRFLCVVNSSVLAGPLVSLLAPLNRLVSHPPLMTPLMNTLALMSPNVSPPDLVSLLVCPLVFLLDYMTHLMSRLVSCLAW